MRVKIIVEFESSDEDFDLDVVVDDIRDNLETEDAKELGISNVKVSTEL